MLWIAAILSLALSGIALYFDPPMLSMDGLYYLKAAEAFLQHGVKAAFEVYAWPFYSIFLASLSRITGFSLESSAHMIDALGFVLITVGFVGIVRTLGANRRVQRWAIGVILLYPALNIMRKLPILRDYMYWGCFLLAIWALIVYCRNRTWRRALAWNAAIFMAVLFRIEGIFLMLLMPLVVLKDTHGDTSSIKTWLRLNISLILAGMGALVWLVMHAASAPVFLARFYTLFNGHILPVIPSAQLSTYMDQIRHWFLHGYTGWIAPVGLFIIAVLYFIANFIHSLGIVFLALAAYGISQGLIETDASAKCVLRALVVFQVIILTVFMATQFFVSFRYFMPLNFLLLFYVPFVLEHVAQKFITNGREWVLWPPQFFPILMICLSVLAFNGLYRVHYSKAYIRTAAAWADTHLPAGARLFSNDARLLYYTNRVGNPVLRLRYYYQKPKHRLLRHQKYFLISVGHHNLKYAREWQALFKNPPMKTFTGPRGDHVYVWKR